MPLRLKFCALKKARKHTPVLVYVCTPLILSIQRVVVVVAVVVVVLCEVLLYVDLVQQNAKSDVKVKLIIEDNVGDNHDSVNVQICVIHDMLF